MLAAAGAAAPPPLPAELDPPRPPLPPAPGSTAVPVPPAPASPSGRRCSDVPQAASSETRTREVDDRSVCPCIARSNGSSRTGLSPRQSSIPWASPDRVSGGARGSRLVVAVHLPRRRVSRRVGLRRACVLERLVRVRSGRSRSAGPGEGAAHGSLSELSSFASSRLARSIPSGSSASTPRLRCTNTPHAMSRAEAPNATSRT